MFKFSYKLTVATVISFVCVFFAGSAAFADGVDHIARAKEMLFNQNDIVGARAEFGQALGNSDYDQQVANFWCAVTEISQNDALRAKLRELKIFGSDDKPAIFDAEGEVNYNPQADADNIIVDDTVAVYYNPATWNIMQEPDPESCYNEYCHSHAAGSGANTAVWTPNVITSGFYKVYAWVTASDLNTRFAEYTIIYPGGSLRKIINQKNGGQWEPLGTCYFPAGSISTIVLSDNTAQGRVIADAIKLEYQGAVIDDSTAGFQTTGGGWQSVSGANGPVYGTYRWHEADASESATATWTFNIADTSKEYLVYVTIPQITSGAAATFKYTINAIGGLVNITVGYEDNSLHVCCLGLFRFSSATGNTLTLKSSASGKVSADSVRIAPARPYPDLTEGQGLFSGPSGVAGMLTQIDAALAHLSNIDNNAKNFTDTVTVDNQTYLLDYGEAKMFESVLRSLKAIIKIDAAYEMAGVDVQPIILNQNSFLGTPLSFLDSYPALVTLRTVAGTCLDDARAAVLSAIDSYYPAADFIIDRNDQDGQNHLLDFHYPSPDRAEYPDEEEWDKVLAEWQRERDTALEVEGYARNKADEVKKNLTDHAAQPFVTIPKLPAGVDEKDMDVDINVDVDLSVFFSSPKNVHSYLDTFLPLPIIYDDTPGIDLGGILPNVEPEDWNYLFNIGPQFKDDPMIVWDNNNTPSAVLIWNTVNDANAASIVKYEIYRASSLDMADAVLVDTITDKAITTYTDTSLDTSIDLHYYRIHTYYDFGGGHTARTYTQAGKVVIRIYVDVNAPTDGTGSKTSPYKSLGYATSEGAVNGTKVCVAAGTYYENNSTLRLWRRSSLIMEGGYEAVNWTRNITSNETVVDTSGPYNWSCINIWNRTFVIDGFTIKGAKMDSGSFAINASESNLTVRNCKTVDCNGGIYMYDCPSVLIENCDLRGRKTSGNSGIYINNYSTSLPPRSVIVRDCTIADYYSKGFYSYSRSGISTSVTLSNNLVTGNSSTGIEIYMTNVAMINNTIVNNKGNGGVYLSSGNVTINNNIIINNTGYGVYRSSGTVTITHNDVFGNTSGSYYNCGTIPTSNISSDPLFVTGLKGDYYLSQTAAGQAVNSSCVDVGSDTAQNLGLNGMTTRTDNVADTDMVDMGYHYYMPAPSKDEVVVDFGESYGIWIRYNDSTWQQLHNISSKSMVTGDLDGNGKDDVIIDFGSPYGIWIRFNDSTWAQLHTVIPESMVTGDLDGNGKDEVIIDFGEPHGVWIRYNNTSWVQLPVVSPESMTTGDIDGNGKDDLVIDFGAEFGIWIYRDTGTWTHLHNISPKSITTGDIDGNGKDDIIVDFGPQYGIWIYYNNSTWGQLHNISAESIATGDIDGNGKGDIIVDFGDSFGIWIRYNDSSWGQLHNMTAKSITTGDIDGNGKDDIIVDFGDSFGIWIYRDAGTWTQLHNVSAKSITTGDIDNN